ncbi:site-specific recombinase [Mesorhizobium sp. Root157]|nr:site-specific recombinase [Mesorhizobium sp. Root157]
MQQPKLRCAVYTRKSTEEGLDQEFNSLDAQREACVAYIASQVGLGWKLVNDHYDDGGISGGTMERPALQRLLADIRQKKIDVVVVYKIDRLTRSLADFSKMVEVFEAAAVSFVSITQQFNTTTSMGRLTLNILLSFAQFEREVTAERIRDKISASKMKGMWMGGVVPLGYRVQDRKLVIDDSEAATVRYLFHTYIELRSVRDLVEEANRSGVLGKSGQTSFTRGALYHLLSNPIYIGKIRHGGQLYDGEHFGIIDAPLFAGVQQLLKAQAANRSSAQNRQDVHLLTSILFDETGDRLSPTHARKLGKRYRYYISHRLMQAKRRSGDGWRLPATELESLIEAELMRLLSDHATLASWMKDHGLGELIASGVRNVEQLVEGYQGLTAAHRREILQDIVERIDLAPDTITIRFNIGAIIQHLTQAEHQTESIEAYGSHVVTIPLAIARRGIETKLVLSDGTSPNQTIDEALVRLIAKSHCYLTAMTAGKSRSDVAALYGVHPSEVSQALPLAFLDPKTTEAILTGRNPASLNAHGLLRTVELPLSWSAQRQVLFT